LKDVDCAYLAGLFDGEGSTLVTFSPSPKPTQKGLKNFPNCRVQFIITNTKEHVLTEILSIYGKGRIYHQKSERHRDMYRFVVHTPPDVKEIVELVKPYARIKLEQLKNLGEAAELILNLRGTSKRVRWTEKAQREFIGLAKKCRALRGSSGGPKGRPRKRSEVATLRVQ
jgi:hypothetical protein